MVLVIPGVEVYADSYSREEGIGTQSFSSDKYDGQYIVITDADGRVV